MSVSQTEFAAATLDPKQAVPEELVDARGRRAVGRFAVYRNNVTMALTGALEIAFPVIRNLVGRCVFPGRGRCLPAQLSRTLAADDVLWRPDAGISCRI